MNYVDAAPLGEAPICICSARFWSGFWVDMLRKTALFAWLLRRSATCIGLSGLCGWVIGVCCDNDK